MKKKIKNIKAWAAFDKETGEIFSSRHREGFMEIYLHPTKKDADKADYGKEYWNILPVKIQV